MTAMDTEDITIVELVEDHEIPCDYSDVKTCPKGKAEWVLYRRPGACKCVGLPAALACTPCKDQRMNPEHIVVCVFCNAILLAGSNAYSRIEPL